MPKHLGKFIPPRLTTSARDLITSPVDAELIFNIDNDCYEVYKVSDSSWHCVYSEGTQIDPQDVGGGAASMVMSFASGSLKHVETTSGVYVNLAHFIFGGTNIVGQVDKININAWVNAASTGDVRLVCKTSGLTIGEFIGISSMDEANLFDIGALSNLPATADVIEIQGRRTSGGGSSKLRIGSLEIEY